MTVTYQLTARRNNSLKIKIEIEETETDETEAIMANPAYYQELLRRKASVEAGNIISFTPQQFDELVQKHSI
ncbi:MAG: hypothetical protein EAZ14_09260 [Runella slithyformis]|nr:MAG: hypothetical protein EAZ14_09260 [Runella slithyformis]